MIKSYTQGLFLFLFAITLFSCSKTEQTEISNSITALNPKVGQKSRFVSFSLNLNGSSEPIYQKDTMVWEITSATGNSFEVKEYLTSYSSSLIDESKVAYADQTFTFQFKTLSSDKNQLEVIPTESRKNSRILNNETIQFLKSINKDKKIEWASWMPVSIEEGSTQGHVTSVASSFKKYSIANAFVNNNNLSVTGLGTCILYDPNDLLIRSLTFNTKTFQAFGWERLD